MVMESEVGAYLVSYTLRSFQSRLIFFNLYYFNLNSTFLCGVQNVKLFFRRYQIPTTDIYIEYDKYHQNKCQVDVANVAS